MRSIAALLLTVLCAGCRVLNPSLDPGRAATIRGVVRDLAGDYLDIRSKSGLVVRIRVDRATRFIAGNRDVSPGCITRGTRLSAIVVAEARAWRATKVLIASGSCTRSEP